MSKGVVIGKFMPPHRGHKYLIDFARNYADDLTVQVCSIASEPIPGRLRYEWIKNGFGGVTVVHNDDENPQVPEDCPEAFWDIWRDSILAHMEGTPDYLFASETYGFQLAQALGATYVPVDQAREMIPISGTAIRQEPLRYWEYILSGARPYFLKRVAIIGPESSGKSTLAANLAAHYGTRWVAEYGRTYLDAVGMALNADVLAAIARGHRASEEALALQANRVLFSDTECIITKLWSQILIGQTPEIVEEYVREARYDLYLVMTATAFWAEDPQRFQQEVEARREFADNCVGLLESFGRRYALLEGDWERRQRQAVSAVDALLREP